jgi:hypothetical protein
MDKKQLRKLALEEFRRREETIKRASELILDVIPDAVYGDINTMWRDYSFYTPRSSLPMTYEESLDLATKSGNSNFSLRIYDTVRLAEAYRIISIIHATIYQAFERKDNISKVFIEKLLSGYCSKLFLDPSIQNDFLAVAPSIIFLCLKKTLGRKWPENARISGRKRVRRQRAPREKKLLEFKYDERPVIFYRQKTLEIFSDAEYYFVMLLNLAARRIVSSPPDGLAHKLDDLLDDTVGYTNYYNLRRRLSPLRLSRLLKSHTDSKGKLMRKEKVYLDIDPNLIIIDDSIAEFESTHRAHIKNKLSDPPARDSQQVESYSEYIGSTLKYIRRNEFLVDDALSRLGKSKLRSKSRRQRKLIELNAKIVLQSLGKNIENYLEEGYKINEHHF